MRTLIKLVKEEKPSFSVKTDFDEYVVQFGAQELKRFVSGDLGSYKLTQWEIQEKLANGYENAIYV